MTFLPLCMIIALHVVTSGNLESYRNYSVLRLDANKNEQIKWVKDLGNDASLDFWSPTDVMVRPEKKHSFIRQLTKMNITWKIIIDDVQLLVDKEQRKKETQKFKNNFHPEEGISFTRFNRYDDIVQYIDHLAKKYPKVANVGSIGKSYEGRSIPLIKISTGGNEERPLIIVDSGIHAREWIAPAMTLYIIQQLVENPSNADLISKVDWHIIPLINPDGYEYSHQKSRLWRKTRSVQNCSSNPHDPKQGVDANRNFDFHWMEPGGRVSDDPCAETFAGPFPFSEPETRALGKHVARNEKRTKLYLTFHSYGNFIFHPWSYTDQLPHNHQHLRRLAEMADDAQVAAGGQRYRIGTSSKYLYTAPGSSDDWVKGVKKVSLTYTVELPGSKDVSSHYYTSGFILPPESISSVVSTFFPAVRVFGEHIASGGIFRLLGAG